MARRLKRVRLPMSTWHQLARQLDPDSLCKVLDTLGADGRTWSAIAAFAVAKWEALETNARAQFKDAWVPVLNAWGITAYELAIRRAPLRLPVIQEVRKILIETGSVRQFLKLDELYGDPATGRELQQLAKALYAGSNRYDWGQWAVLEEAAKRLGDADTLEFIRQAFAAARRDAIFVG